jgi:hypothetical protein
MKDVELIASSLLNHSTPNTWQGAKRQLSKLISLTLTLDGYKKLGEFFSLEDAKKILDVIQIDEWIRIPKLDELLGKIDEKFDLDVLRRAKSVTIEVFLLFLLRRLLE